MANPVDSHRKQLRQKELKKNKLDRKKTREIAIVKKDTRTLENEIKTLTNAAQKGPLSASDKKELDDLRKELERVMKAKQEYVEAHPEHRKFVFPERETKPSTASGSGTQSRGGLYDPVTGRLRDPKKSVYYDEVFNPFGAPPPGMPYRERAPTKEEMEAALPIGSAGAVAANALPGNELEEDSEDTDDDDEDEEDDIVLPAGPPPPAAVAADEEEDSDSDEEGLDDIPMPAGPPPVRATEGNRASTFLFDCRFLGNFQAHDLALMQYLSTEPSSNRIQINRPAFSGLPPRPAGAPFHNHQQLHPPQQPRNFPHHPPPRFQQPFHPDPSMRFPHLPPPPPRGFVPPPPSFTPAGPASTATPAPPRTSMPSGPATISAPPQLRDLKKEATAFLPATLAARKRKPAARLVSGREGLGRIDAARVEEGEEAGEKTAAEGGRVSLLQVLQGKGVVAETGGGGAGGDGAKEAKAKGQGKEEYERWKKEMSGFL